MRYKDLILNLHFLVRKAGQTYLLQVSQFGFFLMDILLSPCFVVKIVRYFQGIFNGI